MKNLLGTSLGRLRVIGIAEGVSFLLLLFVAMPLKYMFDMPLAVRYIGMAHGVLFVLYVILVIIVWDELKWPIRKVSVALVASVIPLGTFWAEKKLFTQP